MTADELEKIYRPSATLMVVAKTYERAKSNEQAYNYQLLLAKRSARTAFAADHYVFPGGVFDAKADENIEWLQHFKNFGIYPEDLNKLSLRHLPNRPTPLMTDGINFSRDISLRITAIREAFEEVGLLLCVKRKDLKSNSETTSNIIHNFDRPHWQHKVHNNALEFLNLCKYLDVIPDLWSLYEWSIWRSPTTALKKYDTITYIVALKEQPQLLLEPTEVEKELWSTPNLCLKDFKNRSLWLSPLNFYEISRLCQIFDWSELQEFFKRRSSKGSTLLMPVYYKCTDYLVGILPGDDCYPANSLAHTQVIEVPLTDLEFKEKTKNVHRITYHGMYNLYITSNIKSIDCHLNPVLEVLTNKSKL